MAEQRRSHIRKTQRTSTGNKANLSRRGIYTLIQSINLKEDTMGPVCSLPDFFLQSFLSSQGSSLLLWNFEVVASKHTRTSFSHPKSSQSICSHWSALFQGTVSLFLPPPHPPTKHPPASMEKGKTEKEKIPRHVAITNTLAPGDTLLRSHPQFLPEGNATGSPITTTLLPHTHTNPPPFLPVHLTPARTCLSCSPCHF